MSSAIPLWLYVLVMACVTYAVRMTPLVLFRKKIHSVFIRSFLYYVPYAVLGAMTIPGIFYSTDSVYSAAAGLAAALVASFAGRSLLFVAVAACAAAYLAGLIVPLF